MLGIIDDFRIYSRLLSLNEIATISKWFNPVLRKN